jgi:pimeloyl-ACP methyl ester carboxylesterase
MPTLRIAPDLDLHYRVDNFTEPWREPETILMLHGNAESGRVWYGWMPRLARHYRIVRPDMRGFGQSTPMPRDFPWTLDRIIDDYCALMDELGIERFHLGGAKIGGTIARAFAARRPARALTLTAVGPPPPARANGGSGVPALSEMFEQHGVEYWARQDMAQRLGSSFPPAGVEWWTKSMGSTALSTQLGFMGPIACADFRADLPKISCPTLVITTEAVRNAVDATRAWQEMIPNSELVIVPGDSYHAAASNADECAKAMLDFIQRQTSAASA